MAWQGDIIKSLAKQKNLPINEIALKLEVTRQAVHDWIKGQVPKGQHLMRLSTLLEVPPNYFFTNEAQKYISVPLHKTRGGAKITATVQDEAQKLARDYEILFKSSDPGLVSVLRVGKTNEKNALSLAEKLRKISGVSDDNPIGYAEALTLLYRLGVIIIFKDFPDKIKSYAFYCKIHDHRVVFINTSTNVLDLIFQLLHEAVHAIRDEQPQNIYDKAEEDFCNTVANHTQFPPAYVAAVAHSIKGYAKPALINKIKDFSIQNAHAMYGLVTLLGDLDYRKDFAGADQNLKKGFATIGAVLFSNKDHKDYIDQLQTYTPYFIKMVARQIGAVSERKIGEWLNIENRLDARLAIEVLKNADEGNA